MAKTQNTLGRKNIWKIRLVLIIVSNQSKSEKMKLRKNMRLGNKVFLILSILFITNKHTFSEEKIISTPLLNIEEIKPSFEELEEESENITQNKKFKEKKVKKI